MDANTMSIIDQAGIIPYRARNGGFEILLITARINGHWTIPKGTVDPGESPDQAAAREALEEAGIETKGELFEIGGYTYRKFRDERHVHTYLMRVDTIHDDWKEARQRARKWMSFEEASELVPFENLKDMIRAAALHLERS